MRRTLAKVMTGAKNGRYARSAAKSTAYCDIEPFSLGTLVSVLRLLAQADAYVDSDIHFAVEFGRLSRLVRARCSDFELILFE